MDLEKLRLLNQDLLQKLRDNQEEFKKRIHLQLAPPSSPGGRKASPESREIMEAKGQKENRGLFPNALRTVSAGERRLRMETPGPDSSSSNPSPSRNGGPNERRLWGRLDPGSPGAKVVLVPSTEASGSSETGPTAENGRLQKEPRKPPVSLEEPSSGEKPDATPTKARTSVRMPQTPKSILLTAGCKGSKEKPKKEAGRVTFVSDPAEDTIPADRWSVRPFLGYDWIAGLLDAGPSSVAEKPDQYFSELQEFRRVNRDACIYDQDLWSEDPASSARHRESETDPASHQCVFCYRLNKRLFPQPLNPESACPVCKTPRNQRPPETPVEPAFVRVSIPRSTLLPAYKHKIHRRKSYEPADDLALPSVSFSTAWPAGRTQSEHLVRRSAAWTWALP
ncbi:migration and invasion-inhibitory protein isoform X2 [Sceloporus undulatus]|uniref:migration and invasion-inhibitory protein isoform X2 n=1 Tax=Sceloporus undulatus TaxID=8520 RepID=UPI001C4BF8F0|nr:migration and invasion-inhibitory protein isoform X2 [Sceloporus undulatus]